MEQILNISKAVEQIGFQKVRFGTVYRSSKYNYVIFENDAYLVYNLFTRGLVSLSSEEYALHFSKVEVKLLETLDETTTFLIENYYLIPENFDEQSEYLKFNDLIQLMDNRADITSYTVLTTTACNARCFYCFEKDFHHVSMTNKTAHDLAAYMINNCNGNRISIHWFGGEPLCNTSVIDIITKDLQDAGCVYSSSITSNGYAFTEVIAQRAKKYWNVSYVQITLDGMADEHNRRKNFYGDVSNPFARIINNIHILLKNDITVSIRINLDQNNIESVKELLPYLNSEFEGEKKLVIYIAKIFDDCGSWKVERTNLDRERLDKYYNEFTRYLSNTKRLRIKAADNTYKYYHCGSNNIHHRTISPEGRFLACHNLSESLSYGSIYDGISDGHTYNCWMKNNVIQEKCDCCALLPECTMFSQCPNIKPNCKEETINRLNLLVRERYNRFKEKITDVQTHYMKGRSLQVVATYLSYAQKKGQAYKSAP